MDKNKYYYGETRVVSLRHHLCSHFPVVLLNDITRELDFSSESPFGVSPLCLTQHCTMLEGIGDVK